MLSPVQLHYHLCIITLSPLYNYIISCTITGPIEFVEPDLSNFPPVRAMSPDPNDKRDSISEKSRQGRLSVLDWGGFIVELQIVQHKSLEIFTKSIEISFKWICVLGIILMLDRTLIVSWLICPGCSTAQFVLYSFVWMLQMCFSVELLSVLSYFI